MKHFSIKTHQFLLLYFLLFFYSFAHSQALSGAFTVGGESPDYTAIEDAVDDLNDLGISGSVVFNIRTGEYNGNYTISEIVGADELNTITFQSEVGYRDSVRLYYSPSTSENNYVIFLDGTDFITLRNLTLDNTNITYSTTLRCEDSTLNNSFINVHFDGFSYGISDIDHPLIVFYGLSTFSYNVFDSCYFDKGSNSIRGVTDNTSIDVIIKNSQFNLGRRRGINLKSIENSLIKNNSFISTDEVEGLIVTNPTGYLDVSRNVFNFNSGTSVNITGSEDGLDSLVLVNNFMNSDVASSEYAILLRNIQTAFIAHNTLNYQYNGGFRIDNINELKLFNNVFNATGPRCMVYTACEDIESDNNCYFGNSFLINGDIFDNFDNFRTTLGTDINSIFHDAFVSGTPSVYSTDDFFLNGSGMWLDLPSVDIENDLRGSPPDIGADEFDLSPIEVSIIDAKTEFDITCPGLNPIYATIINNGSEPITDINLSIHLNDDLLIETVWTGTLLSGEVLGDELIGNVELEQGTTNTIIIEAHLVNGVEDAYSANNIAINEDVKVALSGNNYIGGLYANYDNLADAVNAVELYGTCGNVDIVLKAGTYSGTNFMRDIPNVYSSDTVTFRGETDDIERFIITTAGIYTFQSLGCKNLRFKDLTIVKSGEYSNIFIINETDGFVLENCHLSTNVGTNITGPDINELIKSQSILSLNNVDGASIINCSFENGTNNIHLENSRNFLITDNLLTNFTISGINILNSDSILVDGNQLKTELPDYYEEYLTGIRFENSNEYIKIGNNDLTILGGIGVSGLNCSFIENDIWNNAIINSNANTISLINTEKGNFNLNSLNLLPNDDLDEYSLIYVSSTDSVFCQNSIFKNATSGNLLSDFNSGYIFDYNNVYLAGGSFSPLHSILSDWQAEGNGLHSFDLDPLFISNISLHIPENNDLLGMGNETPRILTDQDGKYRNVPPSIGAYKIESDSTDITLFNIIAPFSCDSLLNLRVDFANLGPDTLLGTTIFFAINDVLDSIYYSEILIPGDTIFDFNISDYRFEEGDDFDIEIWNKCNAWNYDPNLDNDTLITSISGPYLKGTFTVGGLYPDFYTISDAISTLRRSGMCGDVTLNLRNGIYNESVSFGVIPGLSDDTYLTVQSESDIRDSVIIVGNWFFNNSENITVRNLYFERGLEEGVDPVFHIYNTCSNITIENNYFNTEFSFWPDVVRCWHRSSTDNLIIQNNHLNYSFGSVLKVDDLGEHSDIYVLNNVLHEAVRKLATVVDCENVTLTGNTRLKSEFYHHIGTSFIGLEFITGKLVISKNNFFGKGIVIDYLTGLEDDRSIIENNFLGRIEIDHSSQINVYHNTLVSCNVGACMDEPLTVSSTSDIAIHNNIIYITETGLFTHMANSDDLENFQCDNNLYYAKPQPPYFIDRESEGLFYRFGGGAYNFALWKAIGVHDTLSVWGDPQLMARDDLHLNQENIFPYGSTLTIESVTTDIDLEPRSLDAPFYGADEFVPHPFNASIASVDIPYSCEDIKEIWTKLVNTGTASLTSATIKSMVEDGLRADYFWTGELAPYDTADVYLGSYDIGLGNYLELKVWSELPNGFEDPYPILDTVSTALRRHYNGVYTVAGISPDFTDLQAAIDSLALYGICDSVFLNIRAGEYEQDVHMPYIGGVNDTSWVTIQSETMDSSDVMIKSRYDYTFKLDSCEHVHLKHITISNEDTEDLTAGCILLTNQSNDIKITNNYIHNPLLVDIGSSAIMISDNDEIGKQMNNISIENNYVECADVPMLIINGPNNESYEFELFGLRTDYNILIKQNIYKNIPVSDGNDYLIYLNGTESVKIIENTFYSFQNGSVTSSNRNDTLIIEKNTFFKSTRSLISGHSISISGLKHGIIRNNEISSTGYSSFAVKINDLLSGVIENNSFYNSDSAAYPTLYLNESRVDVINNQFASYNEDVANYRLVDDSGSFFDYNQYYHLGALGQIDDIEIPSMTYSRDSLGFDMHSVFGDPAYLNDTILKATNLLNVDMGLTIPEITGDILGNERGELYDIGAYEIDDFEYNLKLLGITSTPTVCNDSIDIIIHTKNQGLITINSFDISVSGSGIPSYDMTWDGSLVTHETDSNYFVIRAPILYLPVNLEVEISNPNGSEDAFLGDNMQFDHFEYIDSIYIDTAYICPGDSLLIGGGYKTVEGVYLDTITSIIGCDSLVNIELLHFSYLPIAMNTFSICPGDSLLIGDNYETMEGIYFDTIPSMMGCDSVVNIELELFRYFTVNFIELTESELCIGGGAEELRAFPSGGVFSGPGVSDDEFVPGEAGLGDFTLFYTYTSDDGCTKKDSIIVSVVDCLGLNNIDDSGVMVFPNPFNDITHVYFGEDLNGEHSVVIYNALGEEVYRFNNVLGDVLEISKENFGSGVYMLSIFENNTYTSIYSTKLVVN